MLVANNENPKCKGQAPDGTQVCAYRDNCGRFQRPEGSNQVWKPFYLGGDDCPHYETIQKVKS